MYVALADVVITNTIVETTCLSGTARGTKTIPANTLVAGSVVEIDGYGVFLTPATGSTVTVAIKLGGAAIVANVAGAMIASGDGTNGSTVKLNAKITVRSVGASGKVVVGGDMTFKVPALNSPVMVPLTSVTESTINTTAANEVDFTAQWDSANVNRSVTIKTAYIAIR